MAIVNCGGNRITIDNALSDTSENPVQNKVIKSAIDGKQDTLVSGTNIKTINGTSILGSGNIDTAKLLAGTGSIATSGWTATSGGYQATLSITGITSDCNIIFPEILGYPGMRATAQANGSITVFSDVEPSESISITVLYTA